MSISLAGYYITEIDNWKDTLDFLIGEIESTENRLYEVSHYNNLPGLVSKIGLHLQNLQISRVKFEEIDNSLALLEKRILVKNKPVDNKFITQSFINSQREMRNKIFSVEKEYLEIKYNCDFFIAQTLLQQNKIKHEI